MCAHITSHAQCLRADVTSDVMQNKDTHRTACVLYWTWTLYRALRYALTSYRLSCRATTHLDSEPELLLWTIALYCFPCWVGGFTVLLPTQCRSCTNTQLHGPLEHAVHTCYIIVYWPLIHVHMLAAQCFVPHSHWSGGCHKLAISCRTGPWREWGFLCLWLLWLQWSLITRIYKQRAPLCEVEFSFSLNVLRTWK